MEMATSTVSQIIGTLKQAEDGLNDLDWCQVRAVAALIGLPAEKIATNAV